MGIYEARCFNITSVHGENEFKIKTLKAHLLPICTHIYVKEEYIGIIKCMIIIIKERARCMCHAIPYQYYTKLIVKSLIACVVKWINSFPTKGEVSKTMRP